MIHTPVMVEEVLRYLDVVEGKIYVDATIGEGGHSLAIVKKGGYIIGIDKDNKIIEEAINNLKTFKDKVIKIIKGNFADIKNILNQIKVRLVDGILYDLGLSLYHIKDASRGFSFNLPGPLDMRYDQDTEITADYLVNKTDAKTLYNIIKTYGQEKYAKSIVSVIIKNRPIKDTLHLAELIKKLKKRKNYRIHPATLTFQALRISVNSELEAIKLSLEQLPEILKPSGRAVVISFHSLEDKLIKQVFKRLERKGFRIITKKPVVASKNEIISNKSARSAKLRCIAKL